MQETIGLRPITNKGLQDNLEIYVQIYKLGHARQCMQCSFKPLNYYDPIYFITVILVPNMTILYKLEKLSIKNYNSTSAGTQTRV